MANKIISRIKRFISLLKGEIWLLDESRYGRLARFGVKDTRVFMLMFKTFKDQKIGFQSVALSFFSFMAIVPSIAVFLYLTKGVGVLDAFERFMDVKFEILPEFTEQFLAASGNIVDAASSGLYGAVSFLLFVWVIIWMMMSVEKVFNDIWKCTNKPGTLLRRIGIFIAILIIAPFAILLFCAGYFIFSNFVNSAAEFLGLSPFVSQIVIWIIIAAFIILVFSAMFKFIPSTHVEYRHALRAAIVSGLCFTVLQYLYLETQLMVTRLNMVYGTIAFIPLFLLWLRYGWLFIVYGAELSYAFQNVKEFQEQRTMELSPEETESNSDNTTIE